MTTFSHKEEGFDEFSDRASKVDPVVGISINEGLRSLGRLWVHSKGTGPLAEATPKKTGALARSTIFQVMGGPDNQRLEIRQGARSPEGQFYGHFVREGTVPHEIRPVRASVLRFVVDGQVVFAKKVNHPGTDPNPYHERVFRDLVDDQSKIIEEIGLDIATYLAGGRS